MEQTSLSGKGALAIPRYGRSNLGTKIDNEGTVSETLRFKYNFQDEILLRGGGGGGGGGGGKL